MFCLPKLNGRKSRWLFVCGAGSWARHAQKGRCFVGVPAEPVQVAFPYVFHGKRVKTGQANAVRAAHARVHDTQGVQLVERKRQVLRFDIGVGMKTGLPLRAKAVHLAIHPQGRRSVNRAGPRRIAQVASSWQSPQRA